MRMCNAERQKKFAKGSNFKEVDRALPIYRYAAHCTTTGGLDPQNYRWQNRKEYKGKTNWAQSALARLLAVVPAWQHPQTTYVPHARWGVGNGGGRRVHQGSTGPAPPPWLHSYTICEDILHCRNPSLRKQWQASYFSILSSIILWLP